MKKYYILGRFGYFIRELANDFRCWIHDTCNYTTEKLMDFIYWLDEKPGVAYHRKKDRGI